MSESFDTTVKEIVQEPFITANSKPPKPYEPILLSDEDRIPNSFLVDNHIRHIEKGTITEAGLRADLDTFCGERAQLPVSFQPLSINENGKLVSHHFPGLTLSELYERAKFCGEEIFELRAPHDVAYIENVELIIRNTNSTDQIAWLRFSPTTGNMSKESHIELGIQVGESDFMLYTFTLPFKDGQDIEEAFIEFRQLATRFAPELESATNEFEMISHTIALNRLKNENPTLQKRIVGDNGYSSEFFLREVDFILENITGKKHFDGRIWDDRDEEAEYNLFYKYITSRTHADLSSAYIEACIKGDAYRAQSAFNLLVNNFDKNWDMREQLVHATIQELAKKFREIDHNNTRAPKKVAGGCGAGGGGQNSGRKIERIRERMKRFGMSISSEMTDLTQCPSCKEEYLIDENNTATWIIKCPNPNCQSPYEISCGYSSGLEVEVVSEDNSISENIVSHQPGYIDLKSMPSGREFAFPIDISHSEDNTDHTSAAA